MHFDATRLDKSLVDVDVIVASVATLEDERDAVLQDREWFDGVNHPEVRYHASRFGRRGDGQFQAFGALTGTHPAW